MTFEGFRYYFIFQSFVLYSASVPVFLNHSETSTTDLAETWKTSDISSTPPDPWTDQPSTISNILSTEIRNSELPSTSYDSTNFSNSTYQSEVWNKTKWMSDFLKNLRKIISETPIPDDKIERVLALEIFTIMATGNHFIIPPNEDKKIEKRLEKNVRALGSIFLDLRYTDVLIIMNDIGLQTIKTIRSNQSDQMDSSKSRVTIKKMQEYLLNFVNEVFYAIDDRDDSLANDFFKHRKSFANKEPITYFSFDNLTSEIIEERNIVEWLNNLNIRKLFFHFVEFMEIRRNRVPVVDLFYELARESKLTINLNEIYVNILDKIAKRFIVKYDGRPLAPFRDIIQDNIRNELITAIKTHEPLRKAYENANIDYEKEL